MRQGFIVFAVLLLVSNGCQDRASAPDAAGAAGPDANGDARSIDAAACTPGAASLVCADARTLSLCTDDPNFDGTPDGPPTTAQITCSAFFKNAGAASCETYDSTTTEALCTMDDGGPCGVVLVTGHVTTARCTTDDAVCMLDLNAGNYLCTAGTGILCSATGTAFVPYCAGNRLVWRCGDDGDGKGQPYIDDCTALGNGTCDAGANKCIDIQAGGRCNATEWLCSPDLTCQNHVCVAS